MAKIAKIIQVVGSSDKSWEDAVATAVKVASKTVKDITGVKIQDMTASCKDGKLKTYKTTVMIAFGVKD